MGDRTKIEWTDATWNPIRAKNIATGKVGWHCEHVTEACRFCYAEKRNVNTFFGNGLEFKPGNCSKVKLYLDKYALYQPIRWRQGRKIFPCSMTDLFADFVPDERIDQVLAVMALTPHHTYQVLTKRPERMRAYMLERWQGTLAQITEFSATDKIAMSAGPETGRDYQVHMAAENITFEIPRLADQEKEELWDEKGSLKIMQFPWPLPNVWFGTSIANQEDADRFVPELLATPAAKRFVSCEPMLGPIHLRRIRTHGGWYDALAGWRDVQQSRAPEGMLDWVICGGESGPNARPMHPDWALALRDQCATAGVPYFFKQWGEHLPVGPVDRGDATDPSEYAWERVGKKRAGRKLGGVEHNAFPQVAA